MDNPTVPSSVILNPYTGAYMREQIRRKVAIEMHRNLVPSWEKGISVEQGIDLALAAADYLIRKTGGHGD